MTADPAVIQPSGVDGPEWCIDCEPGESCGDHYGEKVYLPATAGLPGMGHEVGVGACHDVIDNLDPCVSLHIIAGGPSDQDMSVDLRPDEAVALLERIEFVLDQIGRARG